MKNGADYVATGHYAQIKNNYLKRGKDISKDQSYFLWTLNQKQLEKIIFPVGNLLKSEIRKIAEENNLYTAKKKDSQGLCFIGKIEVKDFLKEFIKNKKGDIFDLKSKQKIGIHDGIFFYTIGEKINGKYIIKKDNSKNILYVGDNLEEKKDRECKEENIISLNEINFIKNLKVNEIYTIQERYHSSEIKIKIIEFKYKNKRKELFIKYKVLSQNNFINIPGQSLVFYKKDTLVGGGIMN